MEPQGSDWQADAAVKRRNASWRPKRNASDTQAFPEPHRRKRPPCADSKRGQVSANLRRASARHTVLAGFGKLEAEVDAGGAKNGPSGADALPRQDFV